jgi:cytochrome P450
VFLVSQHPEVDEKLFEELSDLLADEGAPLDLNQLSAMTHLNMALKESLRMYPPATSTAREADTDVTIGDKYFIPKGVRTDSTFFAFRLCAAAHATHQPVTGGDSDQGDG